MCRKINKINVRKDSVKNIHTTVSVGLTTVSISVCDVDSDIDGAVGGDVDGDVGGDVDGDVCVACLVEQSHYVLVTLRPSPVEGR